MILPTDSKVVYRRYASLFFIAGCASTDNELITLEVVHRYVEQMDKYYGNVCELDIIFNFQKAYFILDELLIAGEMQETSKKNVLRCISQQDSLEDMEVSLCFCVTFPLSLSSFPEVVSQDQANDIRLRKMWSPRSCNQRAGLLLHIVTILINTTLFLPSGLRRHLTQLGTCRAVKEPVNHGCAAREVSAGSDWTPSHT